VVLCVLALGGLTGVEGTNSKEVEGVDYFWVFS